jgi:hypothetical protein
MATKKLKILTSTKDKIPDGLVEGVDKSCELLLECLDVNQVTKSQGVSAMATLIVSILANYDNDEHFHAIIDMMKRAFKEHRKK